MPGTSFSHINNNRGVALLLAVTVVSLLVAVTVKFSKDMRQELFGSANYLAASRLSAMVRSGYTISAALLQLDGGENTFDSQHDNWAKLGVSNLSQLYGSGTLTIQISDLGGRIPLNSLVDDKGKSDGEVAVMTRDILQNLFSSGGLGELAEEEIALILDAITDWIDPDNNETGIEETETSFYQGLETPYKCKNGPIEFIEELLLIRGITSDLYYGNDEFPGLVNLVTVHGNDGKININTAPPSILRSLGVDMNEELVANLVEFRNDEENKDQLKNSEWYTNVLPGDVTLQSGSITTQSKFFLITATAERNEMVKNLFAVVERQQGSAISMISRKIE